MQKHHELKYFVINTAAGKMLDENTAENLVIASLNNGHDFPQVKSGMNNFDKMRHSLEKCKDFANTKFHQHETSFRAENELICDRNREYLNRTYERKILSIGEQIKRARETGQTEKILRMHEGRRKKLEESFGVQLKKIDSKKSGHCTFSDIAVGLIKVEN